MKKAVSVSMNVLDHNLVPKMKVLGEKEKQKVLEKYKITEKELPRMLLDDPAAKALEAKAGDVIEIKREDSTGSYEYYRLVVG
ncbi:MAG: DNA-directed RNA polymerase subunit H [Candidatus Bilamarchaeaceae archaeon]